MANRWTGSSSSGFTDGEYFINAQAETKGVDANFTMPVVMRVVGGDGESTYFRQAIGGSKTEFELGPFASQPQKLVFNEFFSVLSKDKVKKR